MVILVSEKDPRAKKSQGARRKVREGSESSNCRDKGDGDCLGWEGKTNSEEPERDSSSCGAAGHWQSSKGMTTRGSQAHRLSLEEPQTDLAMLCPHPSTPNPS